MTSPSDMFRHNPNPSIEEYGGIRPYLKSLGIDCDELLRLRAAKISPTAIGRRFPNPKTGKPRRAKTITGWFEQLDNEQKGR